MPKRKSTQTQDESQSESELSTVEVDFDFCDFKADTDYIATKRLLQQLFHTDASLFDLGSIADLILSQDDVGSTVKTDGSDGDPLGLLAVINLHTNKSHPAVATLKSYLLAKVTSDPRFHQHLATLLDNATDTSDHVGLIIGERVYNMPPQVMPPSYKMLREEMEWAVEEDKPYRFSHLLILSRIWRSNEADLEDKDATGPSSKKRKTDPSPKNPSSGVHTFHPEDECIQKFATHSLDFDYSHQEPRDRDSFGTDIAGRVMLVPIGKLDEMVQAMSEKFPAPL